MKFCGLILLFISALTISSSTGGPGRYAWPSHFTVRVVNQLQNQHDLQLRCKSGEKSLGDHILHPNQDFHFDFKVNVAGTTLFWCTLVQGPYLKAFTVFNTSYKFVDSNCDSKVCSWFARNDGIYVHTTKYGDQLRYTWT